MIAMEENLVGYLLNALDDNTQRDVERYLETQPGAKARLETLRRALDPLAADKEESDPPPGLTFRTLARVAEFRCRPAPEAPPAPPPVSVLAFERRWYRRSDVLVAASLLVLLGGIGIPSVMRMRTLHDRKACEENLTLFHQALDRYADNNGGDYPVITKGEDRMVAGCFAPILKDANVLPDRATIRCPANGGGPGTIPSMHELNKLTKDEFAERAKKLGNCYSYSLGYLDQNGDHHGPRRERSWNNNDLIPIIADIPARDGPDGMQRHNSLNHGGQNVLYIGGNVRFCKTPHAGLNDDHIYVNQEGKVAAGVNRWDAVLGCRDDKP